MNSLLLVLLAFISNPAESADWGFYSHRLINRMAVFTLPSEMIKLYKFNIDYISDHAVDPDKRRYATKYEAVRHYIDIDHWGEHPFENVPRRWVDALAMHSKLYCINANGDSTLLVDAHLSEVQSAQSQEIEYADYRRFFVTSVIRGYYDDIWNVEIDSLKKHFPNIDCSECESILAVEHFTQYGIVPYHLNAMQQRLTRAFADKNIKRILQLSADFGHYVGDAHVPLHTTLNYNGQLTDQIGIHAFWETRIPELFAIGEYDFFVGKAYYISDPVKHYWDIVLKTHLLVEDVLGIEKRLSEEFPSDQQYCFDERLEITNRTQCEAYARAYADEMKGMVEEQMQKTILAIGSAWYTAWVDGGQPSFDDLLLEMDDAAQAEMQALERAFQRGDVFGREHGN